LRCSGAKSDSKWVSKPAVENGSDVEWVDPCSKYDPEFLGLPHAAGGKDVLDPFFFDGRPRDLLGLATPPNA
jgi:hypothetical protein